MSRLAVALEARDVRRDTRSFSRMRALLDQHHHAGRRRHDLGQRREIEDRVERHRLDAPARARGCRSPSRRATRSPRPTSTTAPGSFLSAIACSTSGGWRRAAEVHALAALAGTAQGRRASEGRTRAFIAWIILFCMTAGPSRAAADSPRRRIAARCESPGHRGGTRRQPARIDRRPIRTSSSSRSTRCAPMRLSSYGPFRRERLRAGAPARTPNLDALAARGTRFDFAHAHAVADAAVARQHPHRPLPVRARRPRQQRLPADAGPADDRDAAQGAAGSRPARSSAASRSTRASASTPGSTSTTTASAAPGNNSRLHPRRAAGRRGRRRRARSGSADSRDAGSSGSTSSIRTPRTRRRRRSTPSTPGGPTTARSPTSTRRSVRCSTPRATSRRAPTLVVVTGDHGEGARRSRRADARPLRLRDDAARAADRLAQLGVAEPGNGTVSHARAPRRHPPDDPRTPSALAAAVDAARALAAARRGAAADQDVSSYFEAMSAMLNRGWAPLRGRRRAGTKVHRSADARALRPRERSERSRRISSTGARRSATRRSRRARATFTPAPPGERFAESPEVAAKLAVARLHRPAARRARRTTPKRRPEEPDGARPVDPAGDRGAGSAGDGDEALADLRARSSSAGRRCRSATTTWRSCNGRAATARGAIADAGARVSRKARSSRA